MNVFRCCVKKLKTNVPHTITDTPYDNRDSFLGESVAKLMR